MVNVDFSPNILSNMKIELVATNNLTVSKFEFGASVLVRITVNVFTLLSSTFSFIKVIKEEEIH